MIEKLALFVNRIVGQGPPCERYCLYFSLQIAYFMATGDPDFEPEVC